MSFPLQLTMYWLLGCSHVAPRYGASGQMWSKVVEYLEVHLCTVWTASPFIE